MRTLLLAFALVASAASAQTDARAVVLTDTPDGIVLSNATDAPVGDVSAVLLLAPEDGTRGWTMRSLAPGQVPSEIVARWDADAERRAHHAAVLELARDGADRHRVLADYHRARLGRAAERLDRVAGHLEVIEEAEVVGDGEIIELSAEARPARALLERIQRTAEPRAVRYEVSAELAAPLDLDGSVVAAIVADDALRGLDVTETAGRTRLSVVFTFDGLDAWRDWMATQGGTLGAIRDRADGATLQLKLDVR